MIRQVHRKPPSAYQVTTLAVQYRDGGGSLLSELVKVAHTYDPLAQVVEVLALGVALVRYLPQNPLGPRLPRYLILEPTWWLLANEDNVFVREPDLYESEYEPA